MAARRAARRRRPGVCRRAATAVADPAEDGAVAAAAAHAAAAVANCMAIDLGGGDGELLVADEMDDAKEDARVRCEPCAVGTAHVVVVVVCGCEGRAERAEGRGTAGREVGGVGTYDDGNPMYNLGPYDGRAAEALVAAAAVLKRAEEWTGGDAA